MPKRRRDDEDEKQGTPSKRVRSYYSTDRISTLSDELVLRILSFLSVPTLAVCQCVSRRFQILTGDSELWKEKYYSRFVRPRALRIPGLREAASSHTFLYSSKLAKWLDQDHLVRKGRNTDWKAQYRLRHNWSRGSCQVKELEVGEPPIPSSLVKYHRGMVVTLNTYHDLRVWRMKDGTFLGEVRAVEQHSTPTSLAIDTKVASPDSMTIAVGYLDGSFRLFDMKIKSRKFTKRYAHASSSNGAITSIASTFPYLLTLSQNKTLSLYRFEEPQDNEAVDKDSSDLSDPSLVTSLVAAQAFSPVTVAIRTSAMGVIASVAYTYSRFRLGWNIGIQELVLSSSGSETSSRIAWTPDWLERSSNIMYDNMDREAEGVNFGVDFTRQAFVRTKPTSLSYSHPYLLASYPDNTLKVYQVSSSATELVIESGRRLWGHTSGVSGAEVSDRGKAVSVSSKGNDIRIWELEDGLRANSMNFQQKPSVRVNVVADSTKSPITSSVSSSSSSRSTSTSSPSRNPDTLSLAPEDSNDSPQPLRWGEVALPSKSSLTPTNDEDPESFAEGYIAFDDEQVIVLNNRIGGSQFISCYDFT